LVLGLARKVWESFGGDEKTIRQIDMATQSPQKKGKKKNRRWYHEGKEYYFILGKKKGLSQMGRAVIPSVHSIGELRKKHSSPETGKSGGCVIEKRQESRSTGLDP